MSYMCIKALPKWTKTLLNPNPQQLKWQNTLKSKSDQTYNLQKSNSLEKLISKGFDMDYYCEIIRKSKGKPDNYLIDKTKKHLISNDIPLTSENFNKYYKIFKIKLKSVPVIVVGTFRSLY